MIRFECDYAEGAHPNILEKLIKTNELQMSGYGVDEISQRAKEKIQLACNKLSAQVEFVAGGTLANLVVVSSILKPYQGVIAADTGHIEVNECGSIEATGHKVIAVKSIDGKLTAQDIQNAVDAHNGGKSEQTVAPGMVYISHPTELGTLYSDFELEALSKVCRSNGLSLYMDGARLGYALASKQSTLSLEKISELCDVFYIGGTKIGALLGEAIVFTNEALSVGFRTLMKQKGAILAKGRLLGAQFDALFTDNLIIRIGQHANELMAQIKQACQQKGYQILYPCATNQLFLKLPNLLVEKLKKKYSVCLWSRLNDDYCEIRLCTSWATKQADVDCLIEAL